MVDIETLSAIDCGIIRGTWLRESGWDSRRIERAVREGVLVRIRPGAYVAGAVWRTARSGQRHRLLVIATARMSPRPLVVSHLSAAAMHGLPTIGDWPATVHVLDPGATGGASARYLTGHRGAPTSSTVVIDGVVVTDLPRTLVDVAVTESMLRSVTVVDAALHRALRSSSHQPRLDVGVLLEELEHVHPARGRRRAESSIAFADGRSETPGESLSRVRIFELGFEVPELQVRFVDVDRGRDAVVDFFWRRIRKAGEFDGRLKYTRGLILAEDQDPGEVVWQEKLREDALRRSAVDSVSRWVWDEAISPTLFHRKLVDCGVPRAARRT